MACYAAVLSLLHTIHQIQTHPRPPISLDRQQVCSLTEKLTFLRDFLEHYSVDDGGLEGRIANAAYRAEDIIEKHIVDQIEVATRVEDLGFIGRFRRLFKANANSRDHEEDTDSVGGEDVVPYDFTGLFEKCRQERPSSSRGLPEATSHEPVNLYKGLAEVILALGFIGRDVVEFKKNKGIKPERNYPMQTAGRQRSPSSPHGAMVGLDDLLLEALDKLTGQESSRQIIPIVGMGGIGKTTLAKNIYENPLIVHHFDFRGWATISQEYDSKEILVEILVCITTEGSKESLRRMREHDLGEKLYKTLSGRRYLIVMDDMWSIEAWGRIKFFFPDYNNKSRIMITTRLSSLALELSGCRGLELGFLDEDNSWNLLQKSAFGEDGCPVELEQIGQRISRNCKGLPLSIVVVGGLLAKSSQTHEHWEYIAENLNSIMNLDDSECCLRTLRLSYDNLSVHLQPCFLYMGIFPKGHVIRASTLIKQWVSEGFLKPISDKTLEEAGEEYLKDLAQRNLVIVEELGYHGNIKCCRIHDLLTDLCIRESKRFTRVKIHGNSEFNNIQIDESKLNRSMICYDQSSKYPYRLLRIFRRVVIYYSERNYSLEDIFHKVNSRHLQVWAPVLKDGPFPSSFYSLWNLQTLIVDYVEGVDPPVIDIWKMPRLRHVKLSTFRLPDPGSNSGLPDLQTLKGVIHLNWGRNVVRRIPNVKKLNVKSSRGLDNLSRLQRLECLEYEFSSPRHGSTPSLSFPRSLRKLTLRHTRLAWKDMADKVGHLPHLRVLKLDFCSCEGPEWETVLGQFCSLTFLLISVCHDLERWTMADPAHLPCLEHLILEHVPNLKAIPLEIGEIPTLKSIELKCCSDSAVISAEKIAREQEDMGNDDLKVSVVLDWETQLVVDGLASSNFRVKNRRRY